MAKTSPEKRALIAGMLASGARVMEICAACGCTEKTVGKIRGELLQAGHKALGGKAAPQPLSLDEQLKSRRLEGDVKALRAENRRLMDELNAARDLRGEVLGLAAEPMELRPFVPASAGRHRDRLRETALLDITDVHKGEVVSLDAMDGVNSYNSQIATRRLGRLFDKAAELLTVHYAGPPPERMILRLGGDLVTGEIHEELAKTNDRRNFPAVREVAEDIVPGIKYLTERLPDTEFEIISTPGNHGRTARKPEAKLYTIDSLDTLAADFVESGLKIAGLGHIPVQRPASGDALVDIYGRNVLLTHGDRIGSRGGQGFVGAAATVARGFKKIVAEYSDREIVLHWIVIGHFHTDLKMEEGYANPSVMGPTEYSRDGRMRLKPAAQRLFLMHPRHGITLDRVINLGVPEEGSIYKGK